MLLSIALALAHADPLAEGLDPVGDEGVALEDSGTRWIDPGDLADDGPDEVVGGRQVKRGKWDDAVGIVMFGQVACTGTLIGPKVVLTAQHCTTYPITDVLVKSKDWASGDGELYPVKEVIPFPNGLATSDVALVLLEREVKGVEPRPIALECILKDYLEDGAKVQIVGFGATTESGTGWNSKLNEAESSVLDANCDQSTINGVRAGCNASVSPGGEIAAGGNGTDACFGDSGGPLYLKTPEGDFLVGVTSRAFIGVSRSVPCRDGGIWARPDAVIKWIESNVGSREIAYPSCNAAPSAEAPPLVVEADGEGTTAVTVVDPDGSPEEATFEIAVEPEHGTARVDDAGRVSYVPDDGFVGEDVVVIAVTDEGNAEFRRTGAPATTDVEVAITVLEQGCGGCDQGSPLGGAAGLLMALGMVRRRR